MSPRAAALAFSGLIALVVAFQLALAAGAPWGAYAMGGAYPGAFPPALRFAALVQAAILAGTAVVVLARAGVVRTPWTRLVRILAWAVAGLFVLSAVLNLITPSGGERLIWAPVAILLLLASLRVAMAR